MTVVVILIGCDCPPPSGTKEKPVVSRCAIAASQKAMISAAARDGTVRICRRVGAAAAVMAHMVLAQMRRRCDGGKGKAEHPTSNTQHPTSNERRGVPADAPSVRCGGSLLSALPNGVW